MNFKSIIIPILAATILATGVRYYFPKVETKTVTNTRTIVQTDIKTVTRTITKKDGTTVTVTETTDHSTKDATKFKVAVVHKEPQWRVGLVAMQDFAGGRGTLPARNLPSYGMEVQKRLGGPLYVGLQYVHPQVGLQIGLEF